jgi:UDP-N-acetyl-D-glucosamine/UDP-N-acetyl-D-galactosamine dehydrogenase
MNAQLIEPGILDDARIAIIGLGYVGLPLAVEFGKQFDTVGFDIDQRRIGELRSGLDRTRELEAAELASAPRLRYASDAKGIAESNIFIVTVPTPIDGDKRPDLSPLVNASRTVGAVLKRGDLVVYESTVYPGATEEVCVPELERVSGLRFNVDFTVGYSPERIVPGDKQRTLTKIKKVTSGSTPAAAARVDAMYRAIITAGTHLAPSIKVAEAAKVIENTQRDVNIAVVNEFALIFQRLGIDTKAVLDAAGTKWNFLPFVPGLVGGHCIGVDPYYLIQKAQSVGYYPDILLACRRINDAMGREVADSVIRMVITQGLVVQGCKILVMGFTFKENCPDIRNTRVVDLVHELQRYGANVDVYDPWANADDAMDEYGIDLVSNLVPNCYAAIVYAVPHACFADIVLDELIAGGRENGIIYDLKGTLGQVAHQRL